jgi:hypothetical protein
MSAQVAGRGMIDVTTASCSARSVTGRPRRNSAGDAKCGESITLNGRPTRIAVRHAMEILQTTLLQCPNCGEEIELVIDCSVDRQEYVEDCTVCCAPMLVTVERSDHDRQVRVSARPENA